MLTFNLSEKEHRVNTVMHFLERHPWPSLLLCSSLKCKPHFPLITVCQSPCIPTPNSLPFNCQVL